MRKFISAFLVLWVIWIALSGFVLTEIIAGFVVALLLAAVIKKFVPYEFSLDLPVRLVKFVFIYIPLFVYKLVVANLQVARIVLSPSLPLNPGFVKIKTGLKGDVAKLTLANSITLTPGTLSVDVKEDEVFVHWVDVKGDSEEVQKQEICGSFEKVLGGIFK